MVGGAGPKPSVGRSVRASVGTFVVASTKKNVGRGVGSVVRGPAVGTFVGSVVVGDKVGGRKGRIVGDVVWTGEVVGISVLVFGSVGDDVRKGRIVGDDV